MLRTLLSFRGLILVFGLVAVGLPVALVGQLGIVRTLNAINQNVAQIRQGQLASAAVLESQLDEETAIRGFAATGKRVFLEPYERARAVMPTALAQLEEHTDRPSADDERSVADLRRTNDEWLRTVATPILRGAHDQDALLLHGKFLIDRFRRDVAPINARLDERYHAAIERRDATIRTTSLVTFLALSVILLEVIAFGAVIARMQRELDRERGFVETLQSAASVRLVPPAHLALGKAYRSATRGTRIGGDVYDVYRLDPDRTLIVMGDVSGKGLTAAVETTFVRFAVRALAGEGLAPDRIAQRFDVLYACANPAPESFVTLFVGIHDRRTGTLDYVNAGHEACWVRRGTAAEMLAPTGPVIGVGGIAFAAARTPLPDGHVLVLATDGVTEARDPQGRFIPIDTVTAWIAAADATTPQALVDRLLEAVLRYTRGRIADDLAILAVEPLP